MKINSKVKNYSMEMVEQLLEKRTDVFSGLKYDRLFHFIDENVFEIYRDQLNRFIGDDSYLVIPAVEQNKSYLKLVDYFRKLVAEKFTRNDILVTIGGGILQDISGFIASTLYRGVKWIFIPTTLLAQADSCIGSKTSINFDDSKNLIGTFYPPDVIFNDSSFCQTLTAEYFNSGLGEIIKFHLLSNRAGYDRLKLYLASSDLRASKYFKQIIASTLEIKKSYFEDDEFDTGRRNLLNYGHCFGHALESASNFSVCHGEAVIVGMGFANLLALKRGLMTQARYDELEAIMQQYYPRFDLAKIRVPMLIKYLKKDKKRIGKDLTLVMLHDVGHAEKHNDVTEAEIKSVYDEFLLIYPKK